MTALAEAPIRNTGPAQRLRHTTAAVRVSLRWFGVRKALSPEQKTQAAEGFGAESDYLSARKKLLDTSHPAYKEVTAVRGKVTSFWKSNTLPYPEPGVRLIRQGKVEEFHAQMGVYRQELQDAVTVLDDHFAELKAAARRRLGQLFNPSDYPASLDGLFGIEWDFPSVEPPDYLLQLNPTIYQQERDRVAAKFQEAVQLAEQAFAAEFTKLVSHLAERLSTGSDGQQKVFRDSAISNLSEFFARFRELNVGSSEELDHLVEQAQQLVRGIKPQELRDSISLRQGVAESMSQIQHELEGMIIDRPRRQIIRSHASGNGGGNGAAH